MMGRGLLPLGLSFRSSTRSESSFLSQNLFKARHLRFFSAFGIRLPHRTAQDRMRSSDSLSRHMGPNDPVNFLEMLRKQIDANLAHHKPSECPLTKKDILDLGQLQMEIQFQENIHGVC